MFRRLLAIVAVIVGALAVSVPAFASTAPCHRPPVITCQRGWVTVNEVNGVYYTNDLLTPGQRLRYNPLALNGAVYTVATVKGVFHGIHTGQYIVTFVSDAGLPAKGDAFLSFTTKVYCHTVVV